MIGIFFEILNFCIFCAVIVYLFRRSFLPQLREKIMSEFHAFSNLHSDHRKLIASQRNLETSIAYQEDYAKVLFKKINHWRNVVDLDKEAQKNIQVNLYKEADDKVVKQAKIFALNQAYKDVAPLVVEQLKQDLEKHYQDTDEAHAYVNKLIKALK